MRSRIRIELMSGKHQAQKHDDALGMWVDLGDAKDTRAEAQALIDDYTPYGDEGRSLDDAGMAEFVARVKQEILNDMGHAVSSRSLVMPHTVGIPRYATKRAHGALSRRLGMEPGGFSELHDYVDANCYGGACDDGTTITLGDVTTMQDIINEWLISGEALAEKEARNG